MAKCKYYKKQRYVSYNDGLTWEALNEFERGDLYETNSPSCSDGSTQFQWVEVENSSMCDGKNRYAKEMQQISYDGEYWYNVFPTTYRKGRLLEANSPMCDNAGGGQYDSGSTQPTSGEPETTTDCPEGYDFINGICVCRTAMDDDGNCIVCQDNENFNTTTRTCECRGIVVDGVCIVCPPGSSWNSILNECVCKHRFKKQHDGSCRLIDPLKITKCEGEDGILTQSEVDYYRTGWTLTSYVIGDCIDTISAETFNGQVSLTSVTMPNTVTSIGRLAFGNCRSLTNITIPSGVTYLGDNLFVDCASLTYADMQCSLSAVPFAMFANCMSLVSADWLSYNNIESIGNKAFINCYSLTSATFNQALQTIGDNAFERCTSIKRIDIPSGVTSIGKYAFSQCDELTSVTINSSAVTINDGAFFNCKKLMKIVFTSETPPTISGSILGYEETYLCVFVVPCGSEDAYKTAWPQYADRIQCNDTNTFYRWAADFGIYCIDTDEYTREKKQRSSDATVWVDVVPAEYREKDFITHYSPDCGFSGDVAITVTSLDGYNRYYYPCSGDMEITTAITSGASASTATDVVLGSCVTSIGNYAFRNCYSLENVTLNSGLTSIGDESFSSCSGLTTITIPNSVSGIGQSAFISCSSLANINLGSGLTGISDYAFMNCKSLSSITIPNNIITIGENAFYNCSLTDLSIPSGVTSIDSDAFSNNKLTSVTISSGITSIGSYAFNYNTGLTSFTIEAATPPTLGSNAFAYTNNCPIYVPYGYEDTYKSASGWSSYSSRIQTIPFKVASNQNGNYKSVYCNSSTTLTITEAIGISSLYHNDVVIGDCVNVINAQTFMNADMSSITFSNSVTTIGNAAFYECTELSSITIPNSVTLIGGGAFYNCSGLTSITVEATTPATLGRNAFDNTNNCPIFVPNGTVNLYKSSPGWSTYADRIQVEMTSKLVIKYSGDSTYTINCDSSTTLSKSEMPATSITYNATEIIIGGCIDTIGDGTFMNMKMLTGVTIPNNITTVGTQLFYQCSGLTDVSIGSGLTELGQLMFGSCVNITDIVIPDTVTTIGAQAFSYCPSLSSITMSNNVTSIGSYAFEQTNITQVYAPSGITSIEYSTYASCLSLINATIPYNITTIKEGAFRYDNNLSTVTIGSGITSIENYAFARCSGLTSVTCLATTPPTLGRYTFDKTNNTFQIYVPASSVDTYKAASRWSSFSSRIQAIPT